MARTKGDVHLETRAKRERKKPRGAPYWHWLSEGCHLGYRKNETGGNVWVVRLYEPSAEKPLRQYKLGLADDHCEADGIRVLDFHQAETKARAWCLEQITIRTKPVRTGDSYTVSDAMREYVAHYEDNGGQHGQSLRSIVNAHIEPHLGQLLVEKLTRDNVRQWLHTITETPARKRRKLGSPLRFREAPKTDEELRKRRYTGNRVLGVLKAGLNLALHDERVDCTGAAWREVKSYRGVARPRTRVLDDHEQRKLVDACEGDFKLLVRGALYSGARYGELTKLLVGNFINGKLYVSEQISKTRKARTIALDGEGREFFKAMCLGRGTVESIFTFRGRPWGKSEQHRVIVEACKTAGIVPRICFYTLRHTCASNWLKAGAPSMKYVADQLGNSVQICERYYAHLGEDHRAEFFSNLPGLGLDLERRKQLEADKQRAAQQIRARAAASGSVN